MERWDLIKITSILNIGTTLEWFDFIVSSTAAAIVWPEVYFSTQSPGTALLLSFTVFGIGFLSRPIGSILFGHFGDKIGRKSSLIWTLLTMGIGTIGIGLDPSTAQIGIIAPVLLTMFRLLQGLGIGGEWGGAATMLTEFVSDRKYRGFWVSWIQQGLQFGVILGDVTFLALERLPESAFISYGWRIAYYVGFIVALAAALLRYRAYETPLFAKLLANNETSKIPFIDLMRYDWKKVIVMTLIFLEASAGFYIAISFSQAYIRSFLHFSSSFATLAVIIGAVATIFGTMFAAYLSDILKSRKKIMIISPIGVILFSFPFFILLNTRVPSLVVLSVAAYYMIELFGWSVMPTFYAEYTPTRYRYTATAFAINLATPLSGGLAPILMTYVLQILGDKYLIAWPYLALISIIYGVLGLIGVLLVREDTAIKRLE